MDEDELPVARFEEHRGHLKAVAYRMLGSLCEAEDAVQEAWLRLGRSDVSAVENLGGWLTTVVSRLCLDALRSRATRREDPLETFIPDPVVSREAVTDPEQQAMLADSVGLALMVVLESLSPAERLSFVLHDMFAVPFDEIAPLLDKTPVAVRQLASRARRRVQGRAPVPDPDLGEQRRVVDAFFAAAREGDFDALVSVLHPDIVLRSDGGAGRTRRTVVLGGARTVASQALMFSGLSPFVRPALVNGTAGVVVSEKGRPLSVMAFTVTDGLIVDITAIGNPDRLASLDLAGIEVDS